MHEPLTNIRKVIFLEFERGTPQTEVWRGMQGAATLQAQCGKIVIAVSEDIIARNADAVFWSLAYRANIIDDVHVAPYRSGGHGPKSGRRRVRGNADDRRNTQGAMPPLALPAEPYMMHAQKIWAELDCHASPRSRRGTAIRWAIGATCGPNSPTRLSQATGARRARIPRSR